MFQTKSRIGKFYFYGISLYLIYLLLIFIWQSHSCFLFCGISVIFFHKKFLLPFSLSFTTLTGVLADNIGISPPPLFQMSRQSTVDVSLSPFISSHIGCHTYFLPCNLSLTFFYPLHLQVFIKTEILTDISVCYDTSFLSRKVLAF